MKKLLSIVALALSAMFASAQDSEAILSTIEKGLSGQKEFKAGFSEKRMHPAKGDKELAGKLMFKTDGYLRMDYDNGELFEIDGKKMTISRDGKNSVLDLNKNMMMRALSHALIYSFEGKLATLAKEQGSTIEATKTGKDYAVTLKAVKKTPKGISRMIVKYNISDFSIKDMLMEEFGGISTYYKVL